MHRHSLARLQNVNVQRYGKTMFAVASKKENACSKRNRQKAEKLYRPDSPCLPGVRSFPLQSRKTRA